MVHEKHFFQYREKYVEDSTQKHYELYSYESFAYKERVLKNLLATWMKSAHYGRPKLVSFVNGMFQG